MVLVSSENHITAMDVSNNKLTTDFYLFGKVLKRKKQENSCQNQRVTIIKMSERKKYG